MHTEGDVHRRIYRQIDTFYLLLTFQLIHECLVLVVWFQL